MKQFLAQWQGNGTCRTVSESGIRSVTSAAKWFAIHYAVPIGSRFRIKERGIGDWTYYSRTAVGIRKVDSF